MPQFITVAPERFTFSPKTMYMIFAFFLAPQASLGRKVFLRYMLYKHRGKENAPSHSASIYYQSYFEI
jgi:hypothetical protein